MPADWPSPIASRAAVGAGRLEHAQRHQVDVGHCQRAAPLRRGGQRRSVLQHAQEVRLLEDHAAPRPRPPRRSSSGSVAPPRVRHLDHLHAEPGRERAHHLARLRVQRLGDHDLLPPGRQLGHVAGVGGHRRAVVAGRVGDVHPGQLADRRLVLEDGLQHALAHLRLVGRVGRQKLAALQHACRPRPARSGRRYRRPGTTAPGRRHVSGGQLRHVGDQLGLGQRRPDVERPAEAQRLGDVGEQLFDRRRRRSRPASRSRSACGERGEAHRRVDVCGW